MTTQFDQNVGDGYQALDTMQPIWARDGYAIVDPDSGSCAVSINTGSLGQTDTLSVAAGSILYDGSVVSVSSQSVGLSGSNNDPRKDTVWVDSTGTVQVTEGTPATAAPSGSVRESTFDPAPPVPSTEPATVLAEVWIPSGATSVSSSDIRDRRVDADTTANAVTAQSIDTESIFNEVYDAVQVGGGDLATGVNQITNQNSPPYAIVLPPGKHDVTESLDFTGLDGPIAVWGYGSVLNPTSALDGKTVVDTTGSHRFAPIWCGGRITDGGNSPAIGILEARNQSGDAAAMHRWRDVEVIGAFSKACWYNIGSEVTVYDGCQATLDTGGGTAADAAVWAIGSHDPLGAVSDYATPTAGSSTQIWMRTGTDIRNYTDASAGGAQDTLSVFGNIRDSAFRAYIAAGPSVTNRSGVRVMTEPGVVDGPFTLQTRVENEPTHGIYISGPNQVNKVNFAPLTLYTTTNEIYSETNINGMQFQGGSQFENSNKIVTADQNLKSLSGNLTGLGGIDLGTGRLQRSEIRGLGPGEITAAHIDRSILKELQTAEEPRLHISHSFGDMMTITANGVTHNLQDLTTISGFTDGDTRLHDGTGTPPRGLADWDTSLASGAGNWRSQIDGSTFGPN